MSTYTNELYQRMTGFDPPGHNGEPTLEERQRGWDEYFAEAANADPATRAEIESGIDEMMANIRRHRERQESVLDSPEVDAA